MPGSKHIWKALCLIGVVLILPVIAWSQCPTENPIIAASEVCPGSVQELSVTFDRSTSNSLEWEVLSGGTIIGSNVGAQVSIQWESDNGGPHEVKVTEQQGSCFYENNMLISLADDFERGRFNCFGDINVPFDENCERLITASMLMSSGSLACPEAFDVTLTIDGKVIVPNPVPFSYAGQVIIATVVHRETRISCQTYVTLIDGSRPQIECKNDTSICLDPDLYHPFGEKYHTPVVTDNCDPDVEVRALRSEQFDLLEDPVFSGFIKRDWTAEDKSGNEGFCSDTIWLLKLDLDNLECPQDTVILCDSVLANPNDPTLAGAPSFAGFLLYQDQHYCDFTIKYEDRISPQCHATFVIDRLWTIKSFAEGDEHIYECQQRIEVVDTVGPQVIFADERIKIEKHNDHPALDTSRAYKTLHFPTLDFGCVANGYFPAPDVFDNCSPEESITIDFIWTNGRHNYKASDEEPTLIFHDLEYGKHIVEIIARDDCHNQTRDTLVVVTKDKQGPYIVADKDPTVNLTNYAPVTWVDVSNFDEGTYDNCHLLKILGRRIDWDSACHYTADSTIYSEVRDHYDTFYDWVRSDSLRCGSDIDYGWTDQIPFCCEDACSDRPVAVELMAIDAYCNVSYIWLNVYVKDKTRPEVAVELPDLEISCKAYHEYYSGQIEMGNWSVFGVYEMASHSYGNIKDSATQTVFKNIECYDPPKPVYADGQVYYNDEPIDYIFHEWVSDTITNGVVYDNCGVEISERQHVQLDKCGVGWISREFTIKGLCGTDKSDSLILKQKIEIVNDCPFYEEEIIWPAKDTVVYGCVAGEVFTDGPSIRKYDICRDIGIHHSDQITDEIYGIDSVCQKIIRTWAVIDWCRQSEDFHDEWYNSQEYHYYEYEQIIYVKDTIAPVIGNCDLDTICVTDHCSVDFSHTITVDDSCTSRNEFDVEWQLYRIIPEGFHLVGSGNSFTASADSLHIGEYKLTWSVTDRCKVTAYCTDFFSVVDCKKPTPICITSTTVKLFPIDLNQDGLIDTAIGEIWAAELDLSSHDNCDPILEDFRIRIKNSGSIGQELPANTNTRLEFGCGDIGERLVEFWVVDKAGNADFCEVTIVVQAPQGGCSVSSEIKGGIETTAGNPVAGVVVSLTQVEETITEITSAQGRFDFQNFTMNNSDYQLEPQLDLPGIDGISTADLIALSKHLLGKKRIHDPLLLKAGDANGSGNISVADLIAIRKLLLGKVDRLPNEVSWYFANQLGLPASVFTAETMNTDHLHFRAAKVGDVTADVFSANSSARSTGEAGYIEYTDEYLKRGDQINVQFMYSSSTLIEGLQATLKVANDRLSAQEVSIGGTMEGKDYYQFDKESIHIVVTNDDMELNRTGALFAVSFVAEKEGWLSEGLSLGGRLQGEVYLADGEILDLSLVSTSNLHSSLDVNVYPNPMQTTTSFEVMTSIGSMSLLTLIDVQGKTILTKELELSVGKNQIVIDRNELPYSGLYHYQVKQKGSRRTGKLLVVD